jgi:glutamyl-tRNA synthetase
MKISHIIRAEEFISTTPHHLLIYKALGYEPPRFAHLPMVLGSDRSKLSKRHGAESVDEFRKQGYLPEAMVNFLALLGWALDDKTELFSLQELIDNFTLERVSKTASVFNYEKLEWMNGVYIRNLSIDDFTERALPFIEEGLPSSVNRPLDIDYVKQIMPLVHERAKTLAEVPGLVEFFFLEKLEYETELLIGKNMDVESTVCALSVSLERLEKLDAFDEQSLEDLLRPLAVELELKTGQLFGALRTATTGLTAAPPLFQTMVVLGRKRCLERIKAALAKLEN